MTATKTKPGTGALYKLWPKDDPEAHAKAVQWFQLRGWTDVEIVSVSVVGMYLSIVLAGEQPGGSPTGTLKGMLTKSHQEGRRRRTPAQMNQRSER